MQLAEAIRLIENENLSTGVKQHWANLGCGTGLFTNALATLLHKESIIYAIDKNISSFKKSNNNNVVIKPVQVDFISSNIGLSDLDGVLMANALHFVKDKSSFIQKLSATVKPAGIIIIVEYDTDKSNQWVPYPVRFSALQKLFTHEGYHKVIKLHKHPSVY